MSLVAGEEEEERERNGEKVDLVTLLPLSLSLVGEPDRGQKW